MVDLNEESSPPSFEETFLLSVVNVRKFLPVRNEKFCELNDYESFVFFLVSLESTDADRLFDP